MRRRKRRSRTPGPGGRAAVLGVVAGAVLLAASPALVAQASGSCTVERVIDGDTFVCRGGERVRLILVDTPEMDDEPLGRLARAFVVDAMPPGTEVRLDVGVQERDRYGRLLAYVHLPDGRMLNEVLAREGYARIMVVPPNVAHVERIREAVAAARAEGAGLWETTGFGARRRPPGSAEGAGPGEPGGGDCHPSYPDVCIPPPPPDLDCGDVRHRSFRVLGGDPHRFDGDDDGVGCEGRDVRAQPPSSSSSSSLASWTVIWTAAKVNASASGSSSASTRTLGGA